MKRNDVEKDINAGNDKLKIQLNDITVKFYKIKKILGSDKKEEISFADNTHHNITKLIEQNILSKSNETKIKIIEKLVEYNNYINNRLEQLNYDKYLVNTLYSAINFRRYDDGFIVILVPHEYKKSIDPKTS